MIKAVLFDLDGTLIDTNKLIIESFKHTLKVKMNINIDESQVVKYFGEPLMTTLRRYDEENAEELRKIYVEFNEKMHDELTVEIEGVRETLEQLKMHGIKVGIVTSKRIIMAERGLSLFHLMDMIDLIVTPDDTEKHKPNPEPVLKACELLGISPDESLVVGDSHYDIICGNNAGAYTCAVKYTALPLDLLLSHNPDYIVDNPMEIIDIVKNNETILNKVNNL